MQSESITSTDNVYEQFKQFKKLWPKKMNAIYENVREESTKIDKLTKIIKGLKEVQQAQNSMNLGQRCSSGDLQVKVQKLTDHIQLFLNKIEATEKQLQELEKEMKKYEGLKKNLWFYLHSDKYNPYYLKERANIESSVSIASDLPGSCAVKSTIRGLRKLGIKILSDVTEKTKDEDKEEGKNNFRKPGGKRPHPRPW